MKRDVTTFLIFSQHYLKAFEIAQGGAVCYWRRSSCDVGAAETLQRK